MLITQECCSRSSITAENAHIHSQPETITKFLMVVTVKTSGGVGGIKIPLWAEIQWQGKVHWNPLELTGFLRSFIQVFFIHKMLTDLHLSHNNGSTQCLHIVQKELLTMPSSRITSAQAHLVWMAIWMRLRSVLCPFSKSCFSFMYRVIVLVHHPASTKL